MSGTYVLKGNIQETYKTIETLHELYESYMLDVVVRALPLVNKLFSQLLQQYIYIHIVARKTTGATAMKP
jgi:FMN-dependent NADH-azoreductase